MRRGERNSEDKSRVQKERREKNEGEGDEDEKWSI